jgi:DNA adenine methylase
MQVQQLDLASLARPKPIVKWAGGKQQLLSTLLSKVPREWNRYIEPFVGGGALFFALAPERAIISDSNPDLITLYRVVAKDVEALIALLRGMRNDEATFYTVRGWDPHLLSPIEQAARTLYLNRTCYNGLHRVNQKGEFNAPYGRYKNPTICDPDNLRAASFALARADIVEGDFREVLREHARPGDFIYLDPPYLPIGGYSDFKRYTKEQFHEQDHRDLAQEVERLHALGCYVLLTNSAHPLVYELYGKHKLEVHNTRRNISKDPARRVGQDVVVMISPIKRLISIPIRITMPKQLQCYPPTRFMGSKQSLLEYIWGAVYHHDFASVLDLFAGSGVVSYMFKAQGKRVISNDYMAFASTQAKALIENSEVRLSEEDVACLCDRTTPTDGFVMGTFQGLYFSDEDTAFIDAVRANLARLGSDAKRDLAVAALTRACLKRRPRGLFTFVGHRYDDGRADLMLTLEEQFRRAIASINAAVFSNDHQNKVVCFDAMDLQETADLVYIDPPYYSPLSDNEYVRRYHFIEGLARDWQGVDIQWHTKTRKFKSYPTPFGTKAGAEKAFDELFRRHGNSIIVVSYSSNSLPTLDEMISLLAAHKQHVQVVEIPHRYSFGNQGHKVGNANNRVKEYLFIGS